MRNFKKILVLLLACVLIFSLAACDINHDNQDEQEKPTTSVDVTNKSDDSDIAEPTVTESKATQPNVTEPSEPVETTKPTESDAQTNEDVMHPYISYEDFGKDNDCFQEVLNNMRNYTGTITVKDFDTLPRYCRVDYKNKYVLDYEYGIVWSVRYVNDERGYLSRLESDNVVEHNVPIDFYANIDNLDKYDYVKIGNVLYGAEKSILTNCHLIKIYLTEDGLIQHYETSLLVKYDEWNKNWDDSEFFSAKKISYEYSSDSLI